MRSCLRCPCVVLQSAPLAVRHAPLPRPRRAGPQASRPVASSDDPDAAESTDRRSRSTRSAATSRVYNAVKEAYVEPVDDKKLMHSAIRGLLLDLDPHSAYLDKSDARAFDEQTRGAYDGVGVELHAPARRHAAGDRADRRHARPRAPASRPATSSPPSTASRSKPDEGDELRPAARRAPAARSC